MLFQYCRAYEDLRCKHEPLLLITPQFETPLPPLQPAVSWNLSFSNYVLQGCKGKVCSKPVPFNPVIFSTPPGWDAGSLKVFPTSILSGCPNNLPVAVCTPGWRVELRESTVFEILPCTSENSWLMSS